MAKVTLWIEAIKSARTEQTVQQCSTLTTVIAPEEDVVFLANKDGS